MAKRREDTQLIKGNITKQNTCVIHIISLPAITIPVIHFHFDRSGKQK